MQSDMDTEWQSATKMSALHVSFIFCIISLHSQVTKSIPVRHSNCPDGQIGYAVDFPQIRCCKPWPYTCPPGYPYTMCDTDGGWDRCQKCRTGFVQPNLSNSTSPMLGCIRKEGCMDETLVPLSQPRSGEHPNCVCDRAANYYSMNFGNFCDLWPSHCGVGKELQLNRSCSTCLNGTFKNWTGPGLCIPITNCAMEGKKISEHSTPEKDNTCIGEVTSTIKPGSSSKFTVATTTTQTPSSYPTTGPAVSTGSLHVWIPIPVAVVLFIILVVIFLFCWKRYGKYICRISRNRQEPVQPMADVEMSLIRSGRPSEDQPARESSEDEENIYSEPDAQSRSDSPPTSVYDQPVAPPAGPAQVPSSVIPRIPTTSLPPIPTTDPPIQPSLSEGDSLTESLFENPVNPEASNPAQRKPVAQVKPMPTPAPASPSSRPRLQPINEDYSQVLAQGNDPPHLRMQNPTHDLDTVEEQQPVPNLSSLPPMTIPEPQSPLRDDGPDSDRES